MKVEAFPISPLNWCLLEEALSYNMKLTKVDFKIFHYV